VRKLLGSKWLRPEDHPLAKHERWIQQEGKATLLVSFPFSSTKFAITERNAEKLIAASKEADEIIMRGRTDSYVVNPVDNKIAHGRAESAMKYLMTYQIEESKIKCFWYPARLFVAPNGTREGRARNRRVEIEVKGKNVIESLEMVSMLGGHLSGDSEAGR
jgi:OmpA-OmpF porin, OOP family